jgi:hypothetical protein
MGSRKRVEREIFTLDAETDPFEYGADFPKPFCWGLYSQLTDFDYWWGDEESIALSLMKRLAELPERSIVYAHNGGKFDFHFLLEFFDPDIKIINGRIAKATVLNGKIELRDSYLILPIPLAQFEKDSIDYNKMKKDVREIHKNEIIRYLRKDCTALHELCFKFYERFGLNLTLAGTALKELKKTGYRVTNTFDRYDSRMRNFYYGGRVQCFKTGSFYATDEPLEYADINSAYPDAMMRNHWCGDQYRLLKDFPDGENGSWFAEITATSEGVLPHRCEKTKKLTFALDEAPRQYYASGWEINKGLELGRLKIHSIAKVYKPVLTDNFKQYIDYWFAEKARAKGVDKVTYLFAKLMQNAAYGKFGQDGRDFKDFKLVPSGEWPARSPKEIEEGAPPWMWHSDTDNGFSFFWREAPADRFYNVATAASITAYVRAYLLENIVKSDEPLYCDTDSIICRKFNGVKGDKLGQWEIEAYLSEVHIAQKKMYAAREVTHSEFGPVNKTKVATKGVRLKFDQIKNAMNKDIILYNNDAPSYSIGKGPRYIHRNIDLINVAINAGPI